MQFLFTPICGWGRGKALNARDNDRGMLYPSLVRRLHPPARLRSAHETNSSLVPKVVDRLIKEVQGANPEFQSGLIRGLLVISRAVLMFCQFSIF